MTQKYGWAGVLQEAQRKLKEARRNGSTPERIAELEGCVTHFREVVSQGVAYPDTEALLRDPLDDEYDEE